MDLIHRLVGMHPGDTLRFDVNERGYTLDVSLYGAFDQGGLFVYHYDLRCYGEKVENGSAQGQNQMVAARSVVQNVTAPIPAEETQTTLFEEGRDERMER